MQQKEVEYFYGSQCKVIHSSSLEWWQALCLYQNILIITSFHCCYRAKGFTQYINSDARWILLLLPMLTESPAQRTELMFLRDLLAQICQAHLRRTSKNFTRYSGSYRKVSSINMRCVCNSEDKYIMYILSCHMSIHYILLFERFQATTFIIHYMFVITIYVK